MITTIIAGDSVRYVKSFAGFTSDTSTAVFTLNGSTIVTATATASVPTDVDYSPNGFVFVLTAVQTQYLKGGLYSYNIRVTEGQTVTTVESHSVTVQDNPAYTPNREAVCTRMIDLINKALLNQLSTGEAAQSIAIAGRSISLMSRQELIRERSFWERERRALQGRSGIIQHKIHI
jgi:hypothetical protein